VLRGNHDHGHGALGCRKLLLELDAAHARHLNVGNDTVKTLDSSASEEILGGREAMPLVASRPNQRDKCFPHGVIVVYDGDQGSRWQPSPFL
jgi:hypothetical protein